MKVYISPRPIAVSLALSLLAFSTFPTALAGPGHDHGEVSIEPAANGPQRLPDGTVFLPKPAQRQLTVRTRIMEAARISRSVLLRGKVLIDPNAGGRVQPLNAGRVEPGPNGLPYPGQAVQEKDVLAYVVPSAQPIDQANQAATLAELRAARSLAAKRLARLQSLSDTVPRKDIEEAQSDVGSLAARIAAVGRGLTTREALVAPVSGVIGSAFALTGQVVDAGELVFEIIDPTRLRIEALAFDPALASNVGSATIAVGNERVNLEFIGASRTLRDQALPLTFRAEGDVLNDLAVGQPVNVFVQTKNALEGISVPVTSVMRSPANLPIVWVKTAPERFEPRLVTTEVQDGVQVAVTSGLRAGDRVVTQGASLINQVR